MAEENELRDLLRQRIESLRATPYLELRRWLEPEHLVLVGPSGAPYDVEVQALWDGPRVHDGDLRVMVSGWEPGRQGVGTTEDFIMAPDGTFVGE